MMPISVNTRPLSRTLKKRRRGAIFGALDLAERIEIGSSPIPIMLPLDPSLSQGDNPD
jgi:hypothetical protein